MAGVADKKSYGEKRIDLTLHRLLWLQEHFPCRETTAAALRDGIAWTKARQQSWNHQGGGRLVWKYRRLNPLVSAAELCLKYAPEGLFMMTYGDGVCDVDISKLVEFHRAHGKIATLTSVLMEQQKGVLDISGDNAVRSFREKNASDGAPINAGYMVGVAAGLYLAGYKPYIHSFSPFLSRRVYDQVFLSVGYGHKSVRLIGSDAGIMATYNGGTHMCLEDM